MKLIISAVIFFSLTTFGLCQSVNAEYEAEHQANNTSEFPLKEGILTATQSLYSFGTVEIMTPIAVGISRDRTMVGTVRFNGALISEIFDYTGNQLTQKELEFVDVSDETIMLSVLDSGEFIVRDNVANFSFYDAAGNEGFSITNATQAPGGEHPSGVAYSFSGETVVLYNPVIQYENSHGSRVSIISGDRESIEIYSSANQTINHVYVSNNGGYISIGSSGSGDTSHVLLFDRFGNELLNMELDMILTGITLTEDAGFITTYSDNRIQVYRTSDQELLGSSTSRSRIIHAAYQPEESLIISIGGQLINGNVNNPEITAINLDQRQLDRHQLEGTISIMNRSDVSVQRLNAGSYRIEGINKPIVVRAAF